MGHVRRRARRGGEARSDLIAAEGYHVIAPRASLLRARAKVAWHEGARDNECDSSETGLRILPPPSTLRAPSYFREVEDQSARTVAEQSNVEVDEESDVMASTLPLYITDMAISVSTRSPRCTSL